MIPLRMRWDQDVRQHVKDTRAILDAYKARIGGPPAAVLDLGAHVGCLTVQAALEGAFVVAVEADPTTADWLRTNVRDHGVEGRVLVIQAAVTRLGGEVRDFRSLGGGQNSLAYAERAGGVVRRVPTVGLEWLLAYMPRTFDLVKCDIEGGEWDFLDADTPDVLADAGVCYVDLELHPTTNRDFYDGEIGPERAELVKKWFDEQDWKGEPEPHPLMVRRWRS